MDEADLYLLSQFPQLAQDVFLFAGLERLFRLDAEELTKLPDPAAWNANPVEAQRHRRNVRERADRRLKRAAALLASPEGQCKVALPQRDSDQRDSRWEAFPEFSTPTAFKVTGLKPDTVTRAADEALAAVAVANFLRWCANVAARDPVADA